MKYQTAESRTEYRKWNWDKNREQSLRPLVFEEFIGQDRIKKMLSNAITSAISQNAPVRHILLTGYAGLGKTTLAKVVSNERGVHIHQVSAPYLKNVTELLRKLMTVGENEVFFIDEIHRLKPEVEEALYSAMEDRKIYAADYPFDLSPFTVIGATTRPGNLSDALRSRFIYNLKLDFYNDDEMEKIVEWNGKIIELGLATDAVKAIVEAARGIPRKANGLVLKAFDAWQAKKEHPFFEITGRTMRGYLGDWGYFMGLSQEDLSYLRTLQNSGRAMGIRALAASFHTDEQTIEQTIEPYLIRKGLISRNQRGRELTNTGIKLLEQI